MRGSASERLIGSIQIEAFVHATEDPAKVKAVIVKVAPGLESEIREETVEGHFDNPIIILRLKAERREDVEQILAAMSTQLAPARKRTLADELEQHLDEKGNLYLRMDKQELYQGRLLISNADDVVKIRLGLAPHILRRHHVNDVYRLCGITA